MNVFKHILQSWKSYPVLKEPTLYFYYKNQTINKFYCTSKYELNLQLRGVPLNNYLNSISKYEVSTAHLEIKIVQNILKERDNIVQNILNLNELLNDNDTEIKKLAQEEKLNYESQIKLLDEELVQAIIPKVKDDLINSIILEIATGVGGQEAMLFAKEIFEMYCGFIHYKGWNYQIVDYQSTDLGGIRLASALVNGPEAFRYFKHEAGVHRVQRIPATEKGGRIHTSTVSVVALPQPTDIDIKLENNDIKIETKRASGAGGQHVNTTDSAVRIVHLPTGLSVECQTERSQIKNRQIAMAKLKALLYQKELDSQSEETQATRKSQVKSNFRNEKIRTYNFPQDRITDHRMQNCNYHNIKGFLEGGQALDNLIQSLDYNYKLRDF